MPRKGFRTVEVSLPESVLADLEDWRASRRPIPSRGEAVSLAVEWFLRGDGRRRDAWVRRRRGDERAD